MILSGPSSGKQRRTGIVFNRGAGTPVSETPATVPERARTSSAQDNTGAHKLAFIGLYVFTLLLYLRPNDLFPGALGWLPIAKIVAISTLLAYVGSKLSAGEALSIFPIELKMLVVIIGLAILFIPIAVQKQSSIDKLTDDFLKVAVVFTLMINLIDTRARLRSIMRLVVFCGTFIAAATISGHAVGDLGKELSEQGTRVTGIVGGIFGNPNDLAIALDLLLPMALALALSSKGVQRLVFFVCSAVLAFGVAVTFSRGGFLGLVAMGGVFIWKVGRRNKLVAVLAVMLAVGSFASMVPNGYTDRLLTIVHNDKDETNSAQQRRELLDRAIEVAANHLVLGIGIGNFSYYSLHNKAAHNAFVEISAELGVAGLGAYLILILAPIRNLRRIERANAGSRDPDKREMYFLSVGVQSAIASYLVCSFFGSVQYQWFIYYIAAYAVSLRCLEAKAVEPLAAAATRSPAKVSGMVWRSQQTAAEGRTGARW